MAIWIIFRREMGQYFASPIAYLIAAGFLLVTGLIFNNEVTRATVLGRPVDPAAVPLFLAFAMVFFAPLLTMRLLAEEAREGTLELLLTAPVNDTAIVVGKFLSAWVFYTFLLFFSLITQQILLFSISFPDYGLIISAYMGVWLYGGAALAVGTLFSSLSDNQVVSAFLGMSALLVLWLGDLAGDIVASNELANFIRKLTLQGHYSTSFAVGIFRAEDVVYFAGIMLIALFIAIRIVESRRWR